MNWPTRTEGETRTRTVFAWWPIRCDDGRTYWLCRVVITEVYHEWDLRDIWSRCHAMPLTTTEPAP